MRAVSKVRINIVIGFGRELFFIFIYFHLDKELYLR